MKNYFPGHFRESEENLKNVWNSCIFVFDANILLNLYRYSDATRKEFLKLLSKIKDRVWLPHRAAEEYLNNRMTVIDQQERSYDETIKSIEALRNDLDNARQHPFVSKKTMVQVNKLFDFLCTELKDNKDIHTERITNDEIKDALSVIFETNIGEPFSKEEIEEIIADGESRYKQKIPPGYKDNGKSPNSEIFLETCRKYGDLIVWKQVIKKSIQDGKSIVLVTDDKKEDWWEKFKGKTVGPRPELVKEFKDVTGHIFYMYQADRFLELARENLNEAVSEEIVKEIREVRQLDKLAYKKRREVEFNNIKNERICRLMEKKEHIRRQIMSYEKDMHMLKEQRRVLENERNGIKEYRNRILHDGARELDDMNILKDYESISEKYNEVRSRMEMEQNKYLELQHMVMALERELQHSMADIEQEKFSGLLNSEQVCSC